MRSKNRFSKTEYCKNCWNLQLATRDLEKIPKARNCPLIKLKNFQKYSSTVKFQTYAESQTFFDEFTFGGFIYETTFVSGVF